MFQNYLKVAIRSLWRFRAFSFINLFGLATGMTVCLLLFAFLHYETGYDASYNKNVYRLCEIQHQEQDATPIKIAQTRFPAAPALKVELPGIVDYTRIISWEKVPMVTTAKKGATAITFGTDGSFFRVFGVTLLSGDTATALKEPGGLVLTRGLARRLFGAADPMGQLITFERRDTLVFRVTGIMADVPEQSHLQYEALYALSTEERPDWMKNWGASWAFTYLKLDEKTDAKNIEAAFPAFLQKHIGQPRAAGFRLYLQPLADVHLYSGDITHDLLNIQKFDGSYIPLLLAVALFVLVLAIINYINLSTARLMTRAKEIGVRKTNGAGAGEIIFQFFLEAVLFTLIAVVIAMVFAIALLPVLAGLTQRNLHPVVFLHPFMLAVTGAIIIISGIAAGLLPAVAMSKINTAAVLKGKLWTSHRSVLRNALVIVQFTVAVGLSMAALTVMRQLKFIQQYDTGFNKEAVIVIPVGYADRQKEEELMHQLRSVAGVQDITGALRRLGNSIDLNEIVFKGDRGQQTFRCASMWVDYNYLSFYHIPLLAGRNFSPGFQADRASQSYIINETMARQLLAASPGRDTSLNALIGKPFRYGFEDSMGSIIGVTLDFNFNSLHERVQPLCITYMHDYFFTDLSIRVNAKNAGEVMAQVEKSWKAFFPSQQLSWHFLDSSLRELYRSDTQTGIFISLLTVIALIISCLGLIGVAAFTIERRTKEIGVRKVLGASATSIIILIAGHFSRLIVVSTCIALPSAWWVANWWLDSFAYHTAIRWWMFALAGVSALLIVLFAVGIQSAKAAFANPVKSIRLE